MRHGPTPHYVCDHCGATPLADEEGVLGGYELESDCPACNYGLLQACEECEEEYGPDYDDVADDE